MVPVWHLHQKVSQASECISPWKQESSYDKQGLWEMVLSQKGLFMLVWETRKGGKCNPLQVLRLWSNKNFKVKFLKIGSESAYGFSQKISGQRDLGDARIWTKNGLMLILLKQVLILLNIRRYTYCPSDLTGNKIISAEEKQ